MKIFRKVLFVLSQNEFLKQLYKRIFFRKYIALERKTLFLLRNFEEKSINDLQIDIHTRLSEILHFAWSNSEYYREIMIQFNMSPNEVHRLSELPILTKEIIRKERNRIISKNFSKLMMRKSNTGGSTGEPLEFYTDYNGIAIDNAHHKFIFELIGYKDNDVVIDSGGIFIPEHKREQNIFWIKYPRKSLWGNYGFSALYLNRTNICYYVNKILELRPAIIRGYPSFINELAIYIIEKSININFKIKGINLTAEYCDNIQYDNIILAFHTQVYFEYGQGEKTIFCWSNGHDKLLRSSPYYGYVEVIKDNGELACKGEVGEIVATSFCNLGMPFIRYKTGDRGIVHSYNKGVVTFSEIVGRSQDYVYDIDKNKVYLTALIFGQHLNAFKNIKSWQLIQEELGKLKLNIVRGLNYSIEDENEMKSVIEKAAKVKTEIYYVDNVNVSQAGKKLFLIQKIK